MVNPGTHFSIQLLPENNVVLVDCPGYESEFFLPQIVNGRVSFRNIIPNRRCCGHVASNWNNSFSITRKPSNYRITKVKDMPVQVSNSCPPLAKSTPLNKSSGKAFVGRDTELTPEVVRALPLHNVDDQSISYLDLENSLAQSKEGSVTGNSSKSHRSLNNSSGFNLPTSLDHGHQVEVPSTHRSSVLKEIQSVEKWRKCITPVRTYERRGRVNAVIGTITSNQKSVPVTDMQSKKKNSKAGTKPPNPSLKMVVQKRKLIIDKQKCLSDSSIKKSFCSQPVSKKSNPKHLVLAKTRKQYEALKTTAFDLLISSNHKHIAGNLQSQFMYSCLNKGSSTHPSFKYLTDLPPLRSDKEVLRLQRQNTPTSRVRRKRF